MKPIIVQQRATGKWFALTHYTVVQRRHLKTDRLVTEYHYTHKHEVTDQIRAILQADRKRRAA